MEPINIFTAGLIDGRNLHLPNKYDDYARLYVARHDVKFSCPLKTYLCLQDELCRSVHGVRYNYGLFCALVLRSFTL